MCTYVFTNKESEENSPDPIAEGVSQRRILKVDRRICPHCDKNVSYRLHKRLHLWVRGSLLIVLVELLRMTINLQRLKLTPRSTGILNPDDDSTLNPLR